MLGFHDAIFRSARTTWPASRANRVADRCIAGHHTPTCPARGDPTSRAASRAPIDGGKRAATPGWRTSTVSLGFRCSRFGCRPPLDLQPSERMIGRVTFCNGARATISTAATNISGASADFWSVGRLISIDVESTRVVALVYEMGTDKPVWNEDAGNAVSVHVELVGEITTQGSGQPTFRRGVSRYPQIGAIAHKIRSQDLELMHDLGDRRSINVGHLTQNSEIAATVSVDDMLKRHFAIVGTTGVGKSCSTALLVRQALAAKPELRVLLLDPHNEFYSAFGNICQVYDEHNLELPFWLFKSDEIEDVVFRGKTILEEAEILRDLIPQAKASFQAERNGTMSAGIMKKALETGAVNADTPVPYRITDLIRVIDDTLGQLTPKFDRVHLKALRGRLEILANDPRYAFMFSKGGVGDNLVDILSALFRLPAEGKPVSIVNLAGLPSDVTNAVVSVLARLAFDVAAASDGQLHVLLVCEEAHRYVSIDPNHGFAPTRRAIGRIAKEGRKYGCSIAIVTQRPGELDPTILSQCSTVFAMRLANDRDQEIIRSAVSDSSASTISFLSALDNREAIVFGEGVATTMRFKFTNQDISLLPRASGSQEPVRALLKLASDTPNVAALVAKLRGTRVSELTVPQPSAEEWVSSDNPLTPRPTPPGDVNGNFGVNRRSPPELPSLLRRPIGQIETRRDGQ